jgi:hypothetical protein
LREYADGEALEVDGGRHIELFLCRNDEIVQRAYGLREDPESADRVIGGDERKVTV